MAEDEENTNNSIGMIVIFSFISVVFLFIAMLLVGAFNNYALNDLIEVSEDLESLGVIPNNTSTLAGTTAETLVSIIPYMDYLWFGSFITLVISSLIFSYLRKRENYFSLFSMSVLGIIVFVYVGGFFIQLTDWFRTEILLRVFPTFSEITPLFSWYLDNVGVINLTLIVLNIIANFIDLDFSKYNRRKESENLDEI